MAFKFIVTTSAEIDLYEAIDWYTSIQEELGQRFYEAVLKQFADILKHPYYYSFYSKVYRRTVVKNFPYLIIFKVHNQEVVVNSIIYGGRNPEVIQKRIT